MIHPLSDCKNTNVPETTIVWQFCVIFPNAQIGKNVNICSHCFIDIEVKVANNGITRSCVLLRDSFEGEDNVMIGANINFTNDKYPTQRIRIGNCSLPMCAKGHP